MSVSKEEEFLHPLTDKWMPLIKRFAVRYNHSELELVQEAYLLEWHMQKDKKFDDDYHRKRYFSKCLYHMLYRRVNGWGIREPVIDGGYHYKSRMEQKLQEAGEENPIVERRTISFSDETCNDILDSLIQMRPFDEIYYEELVQHTAAVLAGQDVLAEQIFRDRVKQRVNQIRWKEIKEFKRYKGISHSRFYQAVKLIKEVVRQEVCYA